MSSPSDGQDFKRLIAAGTAWLEKHAATVNALNVFPVPDGDTGTNMLLTARAAYDEVANHAGRNAGEIAQKVYRGAQFGSRGNSGVILSQLLRGYASALKDKPDFNGRDMADALRQAAVFAYQGVTKPVEGTILTVARRAGEAAMELGEEVDIKTVLDVATAAANEAVENTPNQLKVLRDAGVVDAGGKGYFYFVEGMTRLVRGEKTYIMPGVDKPETAAAPAFSMDFTPPQDDELEGFGYCTEFIVEGQLNFAQFRADMLLLGSSAVVVGDDEMIKVHIHTPDPGAALSYATSHGSLVKVKIDNMDRQYEQFSARRASGASGTGSTPQAGARAVPAGPKVEEVHDFGVVAVAPGNGFYHIFTSMGASQVIAGGQTMNPSVQDLLMVINQVEAANVVVLPNNKNIIMTAQTARELTDKRVHVVSSKTIPQGISAMLAIRHDVGLDENLEAMTAALDLVQTVELAQAVRSVRIDGLEVQEGQTIGILNDDVVAAGADTLDVASQVLDQLGIADYEVMSAYYGSDVSHADARAFVEALAERLKEAYDMPVAVLDADAGQPAGQLPFGTLRIELHPGGQPHYFYIMSVE